MALHDEILREISAGGVPWRFRTGDLKRIPATKSGRYRVGNGEFSGNTINTVPRNHSVRPDGTDPGDYVRKGREPAFLWFGKGEYELILDRQHRVEHTSPGDEEFDVAEGDEEALIVARGDAITSRPQAGNVDEAFVVEIAKSERPDPAAMIVREIAAKPFQPFYRREPLGSMKHGWGERLAAYYWPSLDRNWHATCSIVSGLSRQVQQAIRKLEMCASDQVAAEELLTAFKEICIWGGVKLPESDSSALAAEALGGWQALSQGQKPAASCRLNSAWTKLYAFALPDQCVIYDSRVAAAVTSILDPAMDLVSRWPKWESYAALGTIPGRGGSRPRNLRWAWPNGYRAWASQLAANRLCREVRQEINQQAMTRNDCRKLDDTVPWTLREVEAVLFMEGY